MTAQFHEILILDGEETSMAFCPPLPDNHPGLRYLSEEEVREDIKKDASISSIAFSTACWRGYVGTWEIRDNRFYLVDIKGRFRKTAKEPILADWFSGVLRVPRGAMLQYVHMGFGSVFEQEIHIKIEKGVVVRSRVVDNRGKEVDPGGLAERNLPGRENRFDGDEAL